MQQETALLDGLNSAGTKTYRIEEVPEDEVLITDSDLLVPVAHFHKEIFSTFGVPFLLKLKHVRLLILQFDFTFEANFSHIYVAMLHRGCLESGCGALVRILKLDV